MRIAVPTEYETGLESLRSGHFGHAPYFTIATIEDDAVKSVEVIRNVDHDAVGCGGVIDFAMSQNIDGIIVVGMGMPPFTRFTNAGITVYSERETSTVGGVIERFIAGDVPTMDPNAACNHHAH